MKNILLLLIIILVFFICATVGYNIASQFNPGQVQSQVEPLGDPVSEQDRLIIVIVDALDQPQPKLVSVWFVSLFVINPEPPTLTFAQLYSTTSTSELSKALAERFSLQASGDPAAGFWKVLRANKFAWDNYLVIDLHAANTIMEWMFAQPLTKEAVAGIFASPDQSKTLVQLVCQTLPALSDRPAGSFSWQTLVPGHFRSDIRLEDGLSYWEEAIRSGPISQCEMLPSK